MSANDPSNPSPEALQLEIRKMEPKDADGLVQCVHRCYGSSYPNPILYDSEELGCALNEGLLHSVIALDPKGNELIGHCALSFDEPGDPVPEAGKLLVDPSYRGHHISDQLSKVRHQEAITLGIPGYWSACVTNHPFSQDEIIATGGYETGLLINGQPSSVHMEGLNNIAEVRHSLIPFFIPLLKNKPLEVFLPKHHHAFFKSLNANLGLPRTIGDASSSKVPSNQGSIAASSNRAGAVEYLHIRVDGYDVIDGVRDQIQQSESLQAPVIYIDIPIHHPDSVKLIEGLEDLGFFWGAWLPHFGADGDILRLQKLIDHRIDAQDIVCARPAGEACKAYVLAEQKRVGLNQDNA